jgi:hypothetical protein
MESKHIQLELQDSRIDWLVGGNGWPKFRCRVQPYITKNGFVPMNSWITLCVPKRAGSANNQTLDSDRQSNIQTSRPPDVSKIQIKTTGERSTNELADQTAPVKNDS